MDIAIYRPIPFHIALAVVTYDGAAFPWIDSTGFEHLSAFNCHMVGIAEKEAVVYIVLAVAEYLAGVRMCGLMC